MHVDRGLLRVYQISLEQDNTFTIKDNMFGMKEHKFVNYQTCVTT